MGVVEKNGKVYIKYVKAPRFKVSKDVKYAILSVIILVALGVGIKLLISELASMPQLETSGG